MPLFDSSSYRPSAAAAYAYQKVSLKHSGSLFMYAGHESRAYAKNYFGNLYVDFIVFPFSFIICIFVPICDDLAKGPSRIIQEISFINSGAASKFQKSVLVPKLNKAPKIDIGSKVSELKAKA
ncbi:hypothetical protein E3N88_35651 [Mikania micrantha]|uniref:Uncharacterized protein n=1 Tax=Mikania micrantha TaxID=192012 RepID=A0A5N6M219_9ASTR|nr:hypothetical protein E3N88_35651 [Mikania micrantha]